jgi:hypothetical protein
MATILPSDAFPDRAAVPIDRNDYSVPVRGQFEVPVFGHQKYPPLGMSFRSLRA